MAIKNIKLFLTDVDGCLTDGKVYLGEKEELNAFDIQDGIGHRLAAYGGLQVGWLSGRISKPVARRAHHLKVPYLLQGKLDKLIAARTLCKKLGLDLSQVAYMGDDIIDIPLLSQVGFSATNPYGRPEVKKVVDHVTKAPAGGGAFREVVELILKGQGRWKRTLDLFHRTNVRVGSGTMLV